jgi:hypothetical protein
MRRRCPVKSVHCFATVISFPEYSTIQFPVVIVQIQRPLRSRPTLLGHRILRRLRNAGARRVGYAHDRIRINQQAQRPRIHRQDDAVHLLLHAFNGI